MVQIIRRSDRGPSLGQRVGEALGSAIGQGVKMYGEHKAYEKENEKYKELTGRDLSKDPKIREKEIEYALRGEFELKKDEFKKKTKAEEAAEQLRGEQKIQKEMMSFADRLEAKGPKYSGIADVYRLDIPLDQKTKIVQSITGTDIFREDQQKRLMVDNTLKKYSMKLKELDDEIKNVYRPLTTGLEEVNELKKQRMALRSERDQLLDFKSLNGFEDEDDFAEDEDEEIEGDEEEEGPKVAFNPANKEHKAKAQQLYKKFKDKEKVRKILSKEFKGL